MAQTAPTSLKALPYLLTVPEAAEVLNLPRSTVYDQIRQDRFPHVKVGERVYVSKVQIAQILGMDQMYQPSENASDKTAVTAVLKMVRSMTAALDELLTELSA